MRTKFDLNRSVVAFVRIQPFQFPIRISPAMEPAAKRARAPDHPASVSTRVVPYDPLRAAAPVEEKPIVLAEILRPHPDRTRSWRAWHQFRGRDGKHDRGLVPSPCSRRRALL